VIVPQAVPLQPVPDTVHVTAVFDVPVTDASNCIVDPTVVVALSGFSAIVATLVPVSPTTAVLFVEALLKTVN
jgi:hypothetical protein